MSFEKWKFGRNERERGREKEKEEIKMMKYEDVDEKMMNDDEIMTLALSLFPPSTPSTKISSSF